MSAMWDKEVEAVPKKKAVPPSDDQVLMKWLENQSSDVQSQFGQTKLEELLKNAAQPRHASGNACIKLCYFIEQCRGSKAAKIRDLAFSKDTCLGLFNFFIEWNEKNQNRSMRQVLELVSSLIVKNPVRATALDIKSCLLQRILSIITHQESEPLVKPAFKALECLLGKGAISTLELKAEYQHMDVGREPETTNNQPSSNASWDLIISGIFDWMPFPDVSPAAGKLLVTLFRALKNSSQEQIVPETGHSNSWQRWIRVGLANNPDSLENVKNHLFPPLFKLDRPGSLEFLKDINRETSQVNLQGGGLDTHALLRLAAVEVGKKSGLVEEPTTISLLVSPKKTAKTVILQEEGFGALLCHSSDTVRSLAFSVLVSSLSPLRPLSPVALDIVQSYLYVLHSDTDAKVRNEVLSASKHMVARLRGATAFLNREIANIEFQVHGSNDLAEGQRPQAQSLLGEARKLLQRHEIFLEWYWDFLLDELIPTASYQRHITALKALLSFLSSGILKQEAGKPRARTAANETLWYYCIDFFSPGTVSIFLNLLLDPFEDVRATTASILRLASPTQFSELGSNVSLSATSLNPKLEVLNRRDAVIEEPSLGDLPGLVSSPESPSLALLVECLSRAEEYSNRTGRADYADGVAHAYEILYCLQPSADAQVDLLVKLVNAMETKVVIAEHSLARAVQHAPIHGAFAALSYIWASAGVETFSQGSNIVFEELQARIVDLSSRIWRVVKPILCNDSPEGHLPDDLDEVVAIDTKDVLSFSFRAVHESSNLLRVIATTNNGKTSDDSALRISPLFAQIGNLSFDQLTDLRHRGAFSTVALTFSACCTLAAKDATLRPGSTSQLLDTWTKGVLESIATQVSTTRRSAGLPVLLTAIMAASSFPDFETGMKYLLDVARVAVDRSQSKDELERLPRVHAMNSLGHLSKNSTTAPKVEEYMADMLKVVMDAMACEVWPIHNAGLHLLRSLIDLLLGTNKNKENLDVRNGSSTRIQYDKHPEIENILAKLLQSSEPRNVFPALSILRLLGPPPTQRANIENLLYRLLGSRSWLIRENVAQTIGVLKARKPLTQSAAALLTILDAGQNSQHGFCLSIQYLVGEKIALQLKGKVGSVVDAMRDAMDLVAFLIKKSPTASLIAIDATVTAFLTNDADMQIYLPEFRQFLATSGLPYRQLRDLISNIRWNHSDVLCHAPALALVRRSIFYALIEQHADFLSIMDHVSKTNSKAVITVALECTAMAHRLLSHYCTVRDPMLDMLRILKQFVENPSAADVIPLIDRCLTLLLLNILESGSPPTLLVRQGLLEVLCIRTHEKMLNPESLKSWVYVSGHATFVAGITSEANSTGLLITKALISGWGKALMKLSREEDSEVRLAVASALNDFYHAFQRYDIKEAYEFLLPSLDALYTLLVDDDENVRLLAASSVSCILKARLCPVSACAPFIGWQVQLFRTSPEFPWLVVARLLGFDKDKVKQYGYEDLELFRRLILGTARDDWSLFAEEHQNLFLDECRDAEQWGEAWGRTEISWGGEISAWKSKAALGPWLTLLFGTLSGLIELVANYENIDGEGALKRPMTDRPKGFTIALRSILCAGVCVRDWEADAEILHSQYPQEQEFHDFCANFVYDIAQLRNRCLKYNNRLHKSLQKLLQEAVMPNVQQEVNEYPEQNIESTKEWLGDLWDKYLGSWEWVRREGSDVLEA